jgi:hypothetical protein
MQISGIGKRPLADLNSRTLRFAAPQLLRIDLASSGEQIIFLITRAE